MGVDVGFSTSRDTTAIAFPDDDQFGVEQAGSTMGEPKGTDTPRLSTYGHRP